MKILLTNSDTFASLSIDDTICLIKNIHAYRLYVLLSSTYKIKKLQDRFPSNLHLKKKKRKRTENV